MQAEGQEQGVYGAVYGSVASPLWASVYRSVQWAQTTAMQAELALVHRGQVPLATKPQLLH